MSEKEILKDINSILKTCFPEFIGEKELVPDDLLSDNGINSIAFIKIVVELENKYDIEFQDEDMDVSNYSKISDVITKIISLLK